MWYMLTVWYYNLTALYFQFTKNDNVMETEQPKQKQVHIIGTYCKCFQCMIDKGCPIAARLSSGISWWCHQMETFSALLAICEGNSPHKGQWRRVLMMFSLICAWITYWGNNREAGDFRRHRIHCDVTVCVPLHADGAKWSACVPSLFFWGIISHT